LELPINSTGNKPLNFGMEFKFIIKLFSSVFLGKPFRSQLHSLLIIFTSQTTSDLFIQQHLFIFLSLQKVFDGINEKL